MFVVEKRVRLTKQRQPVLVATSIALVTRTCTAMDGESAKLVTVLSGAKATGRRWRMQMDHHMLTSLVCKRCGKTMKELVENPDPRAARICVDIPLFSNSALLKHASSPKMATELSKSTQEMEGA